MRAHILRQTRLGSQFRTKMFTCSYSLAFFFDILVRSSSYQAYLSCFFLDKHDLVLLEEKSAILRSMLIVNTSALTQPMFSRNMEVSLSLWACLPPHIEERSWTLQGTVKTRHEVGAGEAINGIRVASVVKMPCCIWSVCKKTRLSSIKGNHCTTQALLLATGQASQAQCVSILQGAGLCLWGKRRLALVRCQSLWFLERPEHPCADRQYPLGPLSPAQPTHSAYPAWALSEESRGGGGEMKRAWHQEQRTCECLCPLCRRHARPVMIQSNRWWMD